MKIIEGLLEWPRFEVKTIDGSKSCLDNETRPSPSGIQKLAGKSEAHVSAIITRSLTKKAELERKQAKDTYGHDKISQMPRGKVKTSKIAYSQVSKYVTKSASRNPSAWQNRFALLSSDDESSDLVKLAVR